MEIGVKRYLSDPTVLQILYYHDYKALKLK